MQALDPLRLPLAGRLLLEASAGTGKTWTLSLLVLRCGAAPRWWCSRCAFLLR